MQDFGYYIINGTQYGYAVSLLLAIAEFIGMWLFIPIVFKVGPKIMAQQMPLGASPETFRVPAESETRGGKFRRIQDGSYIFRVKMPLLSFRINTPFPIKGTLTIRGSTVEVHGRIPLSMTLFMGAWLIGLIARAIYVPAHPQHTSFLLMGLGVFVLMVGISFPLEIFRAKKIAKELLELLQDRST